MNKLILLMAFLLVFLNACKKKQDEAEKQKTNSFENTSWIAIQKGGQPVTTEEDKEYLFFTATTLDNYYDYTLAGCFEADVAKYQVINGKLKLTYDDNTTEEIIYKLNNNGTLEITYDYGNNDLETKIYDKTLMNKSSLTKCK